MALRTPSRRRKHRPPRAARATRPSTSVGETFSVVTWEPVNLERALVVIGFPSVGLVGSIATAYLAESLHLREVGYVLSPAFPPTAVIHDGISASPVRVLLGDVVCGPDRECEQLCVIHSDVGPKPSVISALAYALVSWARGEGARQIVCLEGLKMKDAAGEEAQVRGVASDEGSRKLLERMKIGSPEDGLLVGVGGVALYVARALSQPALCLLAETREDFPDARGAAKLLEVLQSFVSLVKIDERPLYEQAKVLEGVFRERRERSNHEVRELSQPADVMFG